jgi:hypothetical protein
MNKLLIIDFIEKTLTNQKFLNGIFLFFKEKNKTKQKI